MPSALNPAFGLSDSVTGEQIANAVAGAPYARHALYRDVTEKQPGIRRRDYFFLGILVVAVHIAGLEAYIHMDKSPSLQQPQKNEVLVEFVKPEVIPPPEPPKPLPPPPKIQPPQIQPKVQPPPKPAAALRTPPAEQNIAADDMTVKENTQGSRSSEPVVAEPPAPPAPPAPPPKEEPITEAKGYAGYLKNPAPDYPAIAERQGWEGKVILKVKVLANGTASSVEVKQSSGRKALDEAAVAAVKGWQFSPSKRGNTPIDGWATVPIEFKLAQ